MLRATTVELVDGLVATAPAGRGPPGAARRHGRASTSATRMRGAGRRRRPGGHRGGGRGGATGARVLLVDDAGAGRIVPLDAEVRLDGRPRSAWIEARRGDDTPPGDAAPARATALGVYDHGWSRSPSGSTARDGRPAVAHPGAADRAGDRRHRAADRRSPQRPAGHHARVGGRARTSTGTASRPASGRSSSRPTTAPTTPRCAGASRRGGRGGRRRPAVAARDRGAGARCPHPGPHGRAGRGHDGRGAGRVGRGPDGRRDGRSDPVPISLRGVGRLEPGVHLWSHVRGTTRWDDAIGAFVPDEPAGPIDVAGAVTGSFSTGDAIRQGIAAGVRAAALAGFPERWASVAPEVTDRSSTDVAAGEPAVGAFEPLFVVPAADGSVGRALRRPRARRDRRRRPSGGRRRSSLGRAHQALHDDRDGVRPGQDLGRHRVRRRGGAARSPMSEAGLTTFRPPYARSSFAHWRGRDRGALARSDPDDRRSSRGTSTGRRPVRERRPVEPAVVLPGRRRVDGRGRPARDAGRRARRSGVMDASTLGKIDLQGPDVGRLPGPDLHEPLLDAQGRLVPVRR